MKLENVTVYDNGSLKACTSNPVALMDRIEHNDLKYCVVSISTTFNEERTGVLNEFNAVPESQIPKDYKGIGRICGSFFWLTFDTCVEMTQEEVTEMMRQGIKEFGQKHQLMGY